MLTNEVKPNTYFNMDKKSRGASGEKNIMEMEESKFRTEPFFGGNNAKSTLQTGSTML